jgi:predicted ATP-dependent endonuclease of OLD family
LLSSHSAATLCCLEDQKISLFRIEGDAILCSKRSKKEIVRELSGSLIQYTEDEGRLLIDNVIRTSSKPVLFVEGLSDVRILNTAYQKLYPGDDIPILIQDAFDRGFLKTLMIRPDIFRTYPQKSGQC